MATIATITNLSGGGSFAVQDNGSYWMRAEGLLDAAAEVTTTPLKRGGVSRRATNTVSQAKTFSLIFTLGTTTAAEIMSIMQFFKAGQDYSIASAMWLPANQASQSPDPVNFSVTSVTNSPGGGDILITCLAATDSITQDYKHTLSSQAVSGGGTPSTASGTLATGIPGPYEIRVQIKRTGGGAVTLDASKIITMTINGKTIKARPVSTATGTVTNPVVGEVSFGSVSTAIRGQWLIQPDSTGTAPATDGNAYSVSFSGALSAQGLDVLIYAWRERVM